MSMPDPKSQELEPLDSAFEVSLRPPLFEEFAGQDKTVERLQVMVEAAKQRGDTLQHILLSGPPASARPPSPTLSVMPWAPRCERLADQ